MGIGKNILIEPGIKESEFSPENKKRIILAIVYISVIYISISFVAIFDLLDIYL
jgi:hypothetical protein